jgi:hypothetical protein
LQILTHILFLILILETLALITSRVITPTGICSALLLLFMVGAHNLLPYFPWSYLLTFPPADLIRVHRDVRQDVRARHSMARPSQWRRTGTSMLHSEVSLPQ